MGLKRRPGPSRRVRVREVTAERVTSREDRVATEEPLEIRLGWPRRPAEKLTVTMRTPGHDFELVAGFLLGEGVIAGAADLNTVAYCTDNTLTPEQEFNVVTAELTVPPRRGPGTRYEGPSAGTSACGVCGKQSVEEALAGLSPAALGSRRVEPPVPAATISALPHRLRDAQRIFSSTGGLHAAGLFEADGTPFVVREDVGRHNAVDKVVGQRVLSGEDTALPIMCVSGRVGYELAQKAVVAGVGVIAAVGAPSSLAVELADAAGLCVVGFVRDERFVVYSAPERIGV